MLCVLEINFRWRNKELWALPIVRLIYCNISFLFVQIVDTRLLTRSVC